MFYSCRQDNYRNRQQRPKFVWLFLILSNPINGDTEGAIESVFINRVSVIRRLNLQKI